jgi:L-threonylcarbamoyladenylate synthase
MTRLLMASEPQAIAETAAAIKRGELVVFPTDTVYGVGTNAFDEDAILCLYTIKRRSLGKGIPILLSDLIYLEKVASSIPAIARELMERFWPGPLTLIVPRHANLPKSVSDNDGVAVRIPDCDLTRSVIRAAGGAVATSSANLSGHAPAQSAEQAFMELTEDVSIVLDGGPSDQPMASTIIDCRGARLRLLRQGPIKAVELKLFEKSNE